MYQGRKLTAVIETFDVNELLLLSFEKGFSDLSFIRSSAVLLIYFFLLDAIK